MCQCTCKMEGIRMVCDLDKPYCGKAKLRYRIEHWLNAGIEYFITILTLSIMVGVVIGALYGFYIFFFKK